MSVQLEYFALNCVPSPLLLLQGNTITFANDSLRKQFHFHENQQISDIDFMLPHLHPSEGLRFLKAFENVNKSSKHMFLLQDNSFLETQIFFYAPDQLCCIFSLASPDKAQLNWLQMFTEKCSEKFIVFQSDFDKKETKILNVCQSLQYESALRFANDLGHGERTEYWLNLVLELRNSGASKMEIPKVTTSNGEVYDVTVYMVETIENGNVITMHIYKEMTEQYKLSASVVQLERKCQSLIDKMCLMDTFFENCPVHLGAVEVLDDEIIPIMANPAALRYHSCKVFDEFLGHPLRSFGGSKEAYNIWLNHYKRARISQHPVEFEKKSQYDPTHWYQGIVMWVGGTRYCYLFWDITGRKLAEVALERTKEILEKQVQDRTRELRDALAIKSNFLAIMSHEMRTPLSGMLGSINLLCEDTASFKEEHQELMRIARICGEQLFVLINDVLDLTKIDSGKMVLDMEPLSLVKLLEDSLDVVTVDAERKELELILDFNTEEEMSIPDIIVGDSCRIRQIIVNLLSNAVKFSSHGCVIMTAKTVNTETTSDGRVYCEIQFAVSDQGIGISVEAQKRLFQPFTQADSTMTRKYGGTGLGLSISKKLAELMKGRIWCESVEGTGSVFYFTIVVEKLPGTSLTVLPMECIGRKIVVATKCEPLGKSLVKKIKSWSLEACHVTGLQDALSVSKQHNADIVLLEVDDDATTENLEKFGCKLVLLAPSRPKVETDSDYIYIKKPVHSSVLRTIFVQCLAPPQVPSPSSSFSQFPALPSSPSPLRLLLAEDNPMNQILESMGYRNVCTAKDGKEAVRCVHSNTFDIILMDVMMPEMTGIEATVRIRQDFPKDKQPIILALTADAFPETRQKCVSAGMEELLTKPVNKVELAKTLAKYQDLINERRRKQQNCK